MNIYLPESLRRPERLAECLVIMDALDTRHLARLAPALPVMPAVMLTSVTFTGDIFSKCHKQFLCSQMDGKRGLTWWPVPHSRVRRQEPSRTWWKVLPHGVGPLC